VGTEHADELSELDAVGQSELVRRGEASPFELVEAAIRRIEAVDPQLNAVIHRRFERALAEAADPALPGGPFRGVPFLLKDLWPTSAGDPLHMGVAGLARAGYRHPTDANLTTLYRRAGLVIVGRTNTPELGLVATTEPLAYGPTRNPWSLDHSPGGSSGGSAAAVAARMVPAANASDGGGSIRIPSSSCGLVGLKPSRGRVSMGPMVDEGGVSVQHVVCRTVRDCAALLDVSAVPFPGDGVIAPPPGRPFAAEVGADPGALRIGLLDHALGGDTHPECTAAARRAAQLLDGLGHHVEEAHPEPLDRLVGDLSFLASWTVNCKANLIRLADLLGRDLGPDDVEPTTWALAEMAADFSAVDLAKAQAAQHRFRREMAAWWRPDGDYDLLLTPSVAAPPPRIGDLLAVPEEPLRPLLRSAPLAAFTTWFNTTGQPAISLPVHRTPDGLPIGAQLAAAYAREDVLLAVAAQLEAELRWAELLPPVHA
jgi:amidase